MAVSYVGVSSGNSGSATSTSFVTTLPSGWQLNDVTILTGHIRGTSLTMTTPAGWTLLPGTWPVDQSTNSRVYAWYRVHQVGDTAPTITSSGSTTGGWSMTTYRGADTVSPIGQIGTSGISSTSLTMPTLTGVLAGSAIAAHVHAGVASGTIPTNITYNAVYTEVVDAATSRTTTAANIRMAAAYRLIASAGNYGGEAVTTTITASMIAVLVEIKQAATPSSVTLTPATTTSSAPAISPASGATSATLTPAVATLSAPAIASINGAGYSRRFSTNGDAIIVSAGAMGSNDGGPITLAALFKPETIQAGGVIRALDDSNNGYWAVNQFSDGNIYFTGSGGFLSYPYTAGSWLLVAFTKGNGSSQVRVHIYSYATKAWTHADIGVLGDFSAPPITKLRIGSFQDNEPTVGPIAVVGGWNRVLTDVELEGMTSSLSSWTALTPTGLWKFDQASTSVAVTDLTGNGANQLSLSGTTVVQDTPVGWTYSIGPSSVTLTPAVVVITAPTISPSSGATSVTLTPTAITATAAPITATPSVTLTPADVTSSARPITATPSVTLTPATSTTSAVSVTSASGPTSVTLNPAVMTISAPTISIVSGATKINETTGSSGSLTSWTATIPATSPGNLVVAIVSRAGGLGTGALTSVTDSAGQTWTMATRGAVSGGAHTRIEIWFRPASASITTVTFNSGASQTNSWSITEWAGPGGAPLEVSSPDGSAVSVASTAIATPAITTLTNHDLVIAATHFATTTATLDAGAFTALTAWEDGTLGSSRGAYITDAAVGTYSASWTLGAARTAGVVAVGFKTSTGPVNVALTPAAMTTTAVALAPAVGAVSVTLTPASATTSAPTVSAAPGAVNVTLTPAAMANTAVALTTSVGPSSVALTPAVMTITVFPLGIGGVSVVALSSAQLTATALPLTVAVGSTSASLTPASLSITARAITAMPGPININIIPAQATITLGSLSLISLRIVNLTPARFTIMPITPVIGALTPGVDLMTIAFATVTGVGEYIRGELADTEGGVPQRFSLIVPGAIAWDNCECGLFAQSITSVVSSRTFPIPATDIPNDPCGHPQAVISVTMSLLRCVPNINDRGAMPSVEALLEAARILEDDRLALRRGVAAYLRDLRQNYKITNYTVGAAQSVGPEGLCGGIELTYSFGIANDAVTCG